EGKRRNDEDRRSSDSPRYSTHPHCTLRNVGSDNTAGGANLPSDAAVTSAPQVIELMNRQSSARSAAFLASSLSPRSQSAAAAPPRTSSGFPVATSEMARLSSVLP